MAGIDEHLTERVTAIALTRAANRPAVVIAKVPLEAARPEANVDRERGRLDSAVASAPRPTVLVEDRLVMVVANNDQLAPLVRFEHRLRLRQQPAVVALHPEPGG